MLELSAEEHKVRIEIAWMTSKSLRNRAPDLKPVRLVSWKIF